MLISPHVWLNRLCKDDTLSHRPSVDLTTKPFCLCVFRKVLQTESCREFCSNSICLCIRRKS
jgi:hypothetical protein